MATECPDTDDKTRQGRARLFEFRRRPIVCGLEILQRRVNSPLHVLPCILTGVFQFIKLSAGGLAFPVQFGQLLLGLGAILLLSSLCAVLTGFVFDLLCQGVNFVVEFTQLRLDLVLIPQSLLPCRLSFSTLIRVGPILFSAAGRPKQ